MNHFIHHRDTRKNIFANQNEFLSNDDQMFKSTTLLYSIFLLTAVGCTRCSSVSQNESHNQPKPIATIRELMVALIDPSADTVWNSVGTISDKTGIHDFAPKNDEEWIEVRNGAIRVIEGANLLMMDGRKTAPPGAKSIAPGVELEPEEIDKLISKNPEVFKGFAKTLQMTAMELLSAIEGRDSNAMMEIGARLDMVCESCHQTFWYPPQDQKTTIFSPSSYKVAFTGPVWLIKNIQPK